MNSHPAPIRKLLAAAIVVWAAVAPMIFVVCVCAHGETTLAQRNHRVAPCNSSKSACHHHGDEPAGDEDRGESCTDFSLTFDQAKSADAASAVPVLTAWVALDFAAVSLELPPFRCIDLLDAGPPIPAPHLVRSTILQV